jgi:hypothetical protein
VPCAGLPEAVAIGRQQEGPFPTAAADSSSALRAKGLACRPQQTLPVAHLAGDVEGSGRDLATDRAVCPFPAGAVDGSTRGTQTLVRQLARVCLRRVKSGAWPRASRRYMASCCLLIDNSVPANSSVSHSSSLLLLFITELNCKKFGFHPAAVVLQ